MEPVDCPEPRKRLNGDERRRTRFKERSKNLERGATAPILHGGKLIENEASNAPLVVPVPEKELVTCEANCSNQPQPRKLLDNGDERRRKKFKERSRNLERGVSAPAISQPSLCEEEANNTHCS